jgi:hypothetical protein
MISFQNDVIWGGGRGWRGEEDPLWFSGKVFENEWKIKKDPQLAPSLGKLLNFEK